MSEDYYTPEGHYLARPLLLPDVRSFGELLEYIREWDHSKMTRRNGLAPEPDLVPAPERIGDNEIGPFASAELATGRRSMAVRALPVVLDAVRDRIVTDDDHLSFKIIEHKDRNRALVILEHGYIIGSHYLAYIDPATIPAPQN